MSARDLLAAATPRPWFVDGNSIHSMHPVDDESYVVEEVAEVASDARLPKDADALLIVAAANEYEALLDIAEAAEVLAGQSFGQLSSRDFYALRESFARLDALRADLSPDNEEAVGTPDKSAPTASTEGG